LPVDTFDIHVGNARRARHEDEMDDRQPYEIALTKAAAAPQLSEHDWRRRRVPKRYISFWVALAWAAAAGVSLVVGAQPSTEFEPCGQIWRTPVLRFDPEQQLAKLVFV
jgi:hypothetical protein